MLVSIVVLTSDTILTFSSDTIGLGYHIKIVNIYVHRIHRVLDYVMHTFNIKGSFCVVSQTNITPILCSVDMHASKLSHSFTQHTTWIISRCFWQRLWLVYIALSITGTQLSKWRGRSIGSQWWHKWNKAGNV